MISTLTHRVRLQAEAARQRERRTRTLLALSRELARLRTTEEIVAATVRHVAECLAPGAGLLLPDGDRRLLPKATARRRARSTRRRSASRSGRCEHQQTAGARHRHPARRRGDLRPAEGARAARWASSACSPRTPDRRGWHAEQRQMVEAFASQAALAVERATLAEEARQAWERVEAEFLRNTLLSGVSHELRTPLAAITGAASTLTETGDAMPPASHGRDARARSPPRPSGWSG